MRLANELYVPYCAEWMFLHSFVLRTPWKIALSGILRLGKKLYKNVNTSLKTSFNYLKAKCTKYLNSNCLVVVWLISEVRLELFRYLKDTLIFYCKNPHFFFITTISFFILHFNYWYITCINISLFFSKSWNNIFFLNVKVSFIGNFKNQNNSDWLK